MQAWFPIGKITGQGYSPTSAIQRPVEDISAKVCLPLWGRLLRKPFESENSTSKGKEARQPVAVGPMG